MKFSVFIFLFFVARIVAAQTNTGVEQVDVAGLINAAQSWAQSNLDEDVLKSLPEVDQTQVEDFLKHYQDYLNGDYVLDLGQLKDTAVAVLPLLDSREETQPLAAWLRARLDYLDAANELNVAALTVRTNAMPPANPSFKAEQELWVKKMAPRPLPKGAKDLVPELVAVFASEGVPKELIWLAEVESGFDRRAESPAGALGLFQLMPATAKQYGLSLWPFDERKQVEPSARAAAQYLRRLYEKFHDWQLVVAAYNCGEGRVQKTLSRRGAKTYEGIATGLPAETQMYVPKVAATILKREAIALEKLPAPAAQ